MTNPLVAPELHSVAQSFLWYADHVFNNSSPLYEKLARRVADDSDLLVLAAHARRQQPAVNLFFGAVHYLLLRGPDDPLRMFYADLARRPNTLDDPFPIFRAFCLEHSAEITKLVSTRRVQTNEVARCALFLPAFDLVAARTEEQPLSMIEVGSSAGLNLNWDRYAYDYNDGRLYGDPASAVYLRCELRGDRKPHLPEKLPGVFERVGIDLQPNDIHDEDAMLWLRALVWPEQLDRAERLERAIEIARLHPLRSVRGDALELVPELLSEISRETPVVLFHSFVLNQITAEARTRFDAMLEENSAGRVLFDIAIEPEAWPSPLFLTTLRDGQVTTEALATCDFHGRWMQWETYDAAAL
jgi:hypothetical protein